MALEAMSPTQLDAAIAAEIARATPGDLEALKQFMAGRVADIYTVDCMPMVADVVSGAIPRPREREAGEAWEVWLMTTPAYRKLDLHIQDLELTGDEDLADFLGDCALVVYDTRGGDTLAFNVDGTRAAIRERRE